MPLLGEARPILSVRDLRASIDYYVKKLGFTTDWMWGDPPVFASLTREQTTIFLCRELQGKAGTWVWVFVDDVDALHREFVRRGAMIRQAPTTFGWGFREMNVQDPDGHRIRFAQETSDPAEGVPLCDED